MNRAEIIGLSEIDAAKLLKINGYNELPTQKKQSSFSLFVKVLSEPMLLLLAGCGTLYFFMAEIADALILMSAVVVVIGITFYQERKTEKTLDALKSLASPRALVIRDHKQIRIPGREVVTGDLIVIREGDRVPADAKVLTFENLMVNESLLTGEAMAVRKGDDLPDLFSGTLVVSGHGTARVTGTGINTEMGKIGKSLETIKEEKTLLHIETARIVRFMAVTGLGMCVLVFLFYVISKGDLAAGLLAGLTLSMSLLPEEFPVVLVIFLTLGAWRISKNKVLTRRTAAIEALGAATVLCTDKTGTLTQNRMELTHLYSENTLLDLKSNNDINIPEKFHELIEYGILASQTDPYDPIEKELTAAGDKFLTDNGHTHKNWKLLKEYSLSKELLAISHVWESPDKKELVIAAKGAPEAILGMCHMKAKEKAEIIKNVEEMSRQGLRVLAGGKAYFYNKSLPKKQHDFEFEFVGLFGFIDPIRLSVPRAIKEAHEAGMRVILITGDYPGTAQFVAKKIGITNPLNFITGEKLEKLSLPVLSEKIKSLNVFARVVPEQKLAIVNALKANGEIVAMTGDGVNDAPALKAAHIGIAMGERGTDVAREASALVLLDDDFSSIVVAVRLGRRIYENLKRAMGYILAVHVPIAGMALLPLIFGFPAVLLPAHIAFLELIIDPACSIVFEAEKEDDLIMKRPPRELKTPMFTRKTAVINILQGIGVLVCTFGLFMYAMNSGKSEAEARSFAFLGLVLANLLLISVNLSWSKNIFQIIMEGNKTLFAVCGGTIICLYSVLYIPGLSDLFHLAPISVSDNLIVVITALGSLAWFEILKLGGISGKQMVY
jgi:Ca2+-transporting ATPase